MQRLRPGYRKNLAPIALVAALLAASCGSTESAEPTESPGEDTTAVTPNPETSQGPASHVLVLQSLLPSSVDFNPQWQFWPEPLFEIDPACEMGRPVASVKNRFALISEVSVLGNEGGFGIHYFETEADAEAELEWMNSERSDRCDVLMTPVTDDAIVAASAGAYSVDAETTVGRPTEVPPELDGFSADAREYDIVYLGANESLEVKVIFYQVRVGQYTAWSRWVGPVGDQPDPGFLTSLAKLGDELEALGPLTGSDAIDQLGERARAVSIADLLPPRFDSAAPATLTAPDPLGECESPDPTSAVLSLEGPAWNSLQGRAGEFLEQSVLAFETAPEAQRFFDDLKTDGLACLATAPIWTEPMFMNNSVDQWEDVRVVGDEDVELLFLRSLASQTVADIEVEVEFTAAYVVRGELVFGLEFGGLLGDADSFMADALLAMYEQDGS